MSTTEPPTPTDTIIEDADTFEVPRDALATSRVDEVYHPITPDVDGFKEIGSAFMFM